MKSSRPHPAGPHPPAARAHPAALYYLAFTEAWERFSFYGMTALLTLYMVNHLLTPDHAAHVVGLASLRALLEGIFGPLSGQGLASQLFGLYSGLVYFTPLLGGALADRWIGQRNAVVIGALSMAAGHLAMTFDAAFLAALALLILGSGLLKGNIAAQVGSLYPPDDEARRARGYVIFSTGINIGAVIGPLLCGLLAEYEGWHYGFGAAAIGMLIGLVVYLRGYRLLPPRARLGQRSSGALTAGDRRTIRALILIIAVTILQSIAYYQSYNVGPLWIQAHIAPQIAGMRIPVPWYQSVNALASIVAVPVLFWIWRWQAARQREPDDLEKITIGAWLMAASNLLPAAATLGGHAQPASPLWALVYSVGLGLGFIYYWPTLLALISQAAPPSLNATLMAVGYLSLFVANLLIGWIGGLYARLGPDTFWMLHAAIAAGGGVAVLACAQRIRAATHHVSGR